MINQETKAFAESIMKNVGEEADKLYHDGMSIVGDNVNTAIHFLSQSTVLYAVGKSIAKAIVEHTPVPPNPDGEKK
jgi:hypothetical protein